MSFEKYINEKGEVGVLVSPGFGAGWSTWEYKYSALKAMEKGLVKLALEKASEAEVEEYINKNLPLLADTYTGGWKTIKVVWLKPDTKFLIQEWDGAEGICLLDDIKFLVA